MPTITTLPVRSSTLIFEAGIVGARASLTATGEAYARRMTSAVSTSGGAGASIGSASPTAISSSVMSALACATSRSDPMTIRALVRSSELTFSSGTRAAKFSLTLAAEA
ncbi:MAG: hypothetical protein BWY85_01974 [Firmicutes bacterium ADurb.Bin506]|nr:MAG: hypothetical protein BWY85_01974 [Firmicutes bacterium ADurb.Bin506]